MLRLRLKEVLDGLLVTESELGRRMGRTRQYVHKILVREDARIAGGRGKGVTIATVDQLAQALAVDPLILITREQQKDVR